MLNSITGAELEPWQEEQLTLLSTVRRNAKKAARSGNPAKRIPARRVLKDLPGAYVGTLMGRRYRS